MLQVQPAIGERASQSLLLRNSVRKLEDAATLQNDLGDQFTPLVFDVTDQQAVTAAVELVSSDLQGRCLAALVSNAGGPVVQDIRQ